MSWWRKSPPRGSGTEADPVVREDRSQHPVKYQCHACNRWIVEPEADLMLRDMGEAYSTVINWLYNPLCDDCARTARNRDWDRHLAEADREWNKVLHE